jgi:magnesium transporter
MSELDQKIETPIDRDQESWHVLQDLVDAGRRQELNSFLESLSSGETARAISRLSSETQNKLLVLLSPEEAAELIEDLPDAQAVDLIEELPEEQAAAIVDEMTSDQQADILSALDRDDAESILEQMDPEEAKDARALMEFGEDTAGGIMVTEFLRYPQTTPVRAVLDDLRLNAETYSHYDVLYAYVVDEQNKLVGVVRLRDLLLAPNDTPVQKLMTDKIIKVGVDTGLDDLEDIFERYEYFGLPVVDSQNHLLGILKRASLREALEDKADKRFLAASGILGGEELRSLPQRVRTLRRLSFLILKIGLNLVSASIIGLYSDTLEAAVALALFLPIISDLGGVSGNQSLAVSIREMALGVITPRDYFLVFWSEAKVGLSLGVLMGLILGSAAALWRENIVLGLVVGAALMLNTLIAVTVGGVLPLLLKRLKVDPAVASSGILTFVTDACGFFFVLSFASLVISRL